MHTWFRQIVGFCILSLTCVNVWTFVCMDMCACVHACMRACVHACVRACGYGWVVVGCFINVEHGGT